jgi:Fic family protein
MEFVRDQPFNDLPPLPQAAEVESRSVLKKTVGAAAALAELRGAGGRIPNPGILINAIGLQEAKLSSEIENIVTTNDAIYQAASEIKGDNEPAAKEVLRYRQALWHGYQAMQTRSLLTTNLFVDIARIIKDRSDFDIRRITGTKIVDSQNRTIYTPPFGEQVIRDKLAGLEKYIHDEEATEPLVKLALMHYQFEAIHPFHDGNGRTGRILNLLFLLQRELLDIPVLYLSRYIIEHKARYYALLQGVTARQEWEPWILYLLDAIEVTAKSTLEKVDAILSLMDATAEKIKTARPAIYSRELVEVLFEQPYVRIMFLERADVAKRQTASRYLKELESIGLLRSVRHGREVYYVNEGLVEVLAA